MSFFIAAMWSAAALFALDLLHAFFAMVRAPARVDLVTGVLCQGIAFLCTLYALVFVYDREKPASEVLGLRRPSLALAVLAMAIGVSLHGPLTLMANAIYGRFPLPDQDVEVMRELLTASTLRDQIALVVAAGVVGPVVEEIFFRGALYRHLRRAHPPGLTLFGVSLLFAAAHLDPRSFFPDFMGGLAMGYVRALSGSLWPAILLHAAFNTVSMLVAVRSGPDADLFSRQENLAAVPVTLALVALYGAVALRSRFSADARQQDLA